MRSARRGRKMQSHVFRRRSMSRRLNIEIPAQKTAGHGPTDNMFRCNLTESRACCSLSEVNQSPQGKASYLCFCSYLEVHARQGQRCQAHSEGRVSVQQCKLNERNGMIIWKSGCHASLQGSVLVQRHGEGAFTAGYVFLSHIVTAHTQILALHAFLIMHLPVDS
jgi:hypothetical protein